MSFVKQVHFQTYIVDIWINWNSGPRNKALLTYLVKINTEVIVTGCLSIIFVLKDIGELMIQDLVQLMLWNRCLLGKWWKKNSIHGCTLHFPGPPSSTSNTRFVVLMLLSFVDTNTVGVSVNVSSHLSLHVPVQSTFADQSDAETSANNRVQYNIYYIIYNMCTVYTTEIYMIIYNIYTYIHLYLYSTSQTYLSPGVHWHPQTAFWHYFAGEPANCHKPAYWPSLFIFVAIAEV